MRTRSAENQSIRIPLPSIHQENNSCSVLTHCNLRLFQHRRARTHTHSTQDSVPLPSGRRPPPPAAALPKDTDLVRRFEPGLLQRLVPVAADRSRRLEGRDKAASDGADHQGSFGEIHGAQCKVQRRVQRQRQTERKRTKRARKAAAGK